MLRQKRHGDHGARPRVVRGATGPPSIEALATPTGEDVGCKRSSGELLAADRTPVEVSHQGAVQVGHSQKCAADLDERHGHVADVVDHRLLCVCRPCYLLFSPQGAGGGRYRGVGEDVRRVGDLLLDDARWDSLRVPVDLVFFFRQTLRDVDSSGHDPGSSGRAAADHLLAFYPGPGGATESELDLATWDDISRANPVLDELEHDVEAVLMRRHDDSYSCYLVPIDVCYELVGVVRSRWTGLGGGPEVWREIEAFFGGLDDRATVVPRQGESRTDEMSDA